MDNLTGNGAGWYDKDKTSKSAVESKKKEKPRKSKDLTVIIASLKAIEADLKNNQEIHSDRNLSDAIVDVEAAIRALGKLSNN